MRGRCQIVRGVEALDLQKAVHRLGNAQEVDVEAMLFLGYHFKKSGTNTSSSVLYFESATTVAIAMLMSYLRRYDKDAFSGVSRDDLIEFSRRHLKAGNITDEGHAVLALWAAMPPGADGVATLRMICQMIERGSQ